MRALTGRGALRRSHAPNAVDQAYVEERAYRHADEAPSTPVPKMYPTETTVPAAAPAGGADGGARLIAAVAVLKRDEWANLIEALPLGAHRWRFLALGEPASGLDDRIVIGVNGAASTRDTFEQTSDGVP